MASTVVELLWLCFILQDLGIHTSRPPILPYDNLNVLHMTINPAFHGHSKHIELDYHYVLEKVALGTLELGWSLPFTSCRPLHQAPTQDTFPGLKGQTRPFVWSTAHFEGE